MGESFSLTLTWGERTSFELIKNRKKGDKKKYPVPPGTRLILILCLIFFSNLPPLGARVMLALKPPQSWSSSRHHDAGIMRFQKKMASFSRRVKTGIVTSW